MIGTMQHLNGIDETTEQAAWAKLWNSLHQNILIVAKQKSYTGKATLEIEFVKGGIRSKKIGLLWQEY